MPRRIIAFIVMLTLLCSFSVKSFAADQISVLIDGEPIAFDVQPQNIDGRVMVPFRAISEAVGALVDWDPDAQRVWMYRNGQYIGMTIGDKIARIGTMGGPEIPIELDVAPIIVDGRTLVPVRAVSEGLKCGVDWDAATNTVLISSVDPLQPVIDSQEALMAFIEENIAQQNTKFSANTVGLPQDVISMSISDYFQDVQNSNTTWGSYSVDGQQYTYIRYTVTYSLFAHVSKAMETGDTNTLTPEEKQVYDKVYQIVGDNISPDMTDYEKELALHDYMVRNITYDESPLGQIPWDSHTPYGALVKGVAVCNGYADSFKLLMDAVGIDCDVIYGEATSFYGVTLTHAWNRVKIDGDYYMVDVTYDDEDIPGYVTYDYFNLTDDMISVDHTPYTADTQCVSEKYNYFVYNNLVVSDQNGIDNIIRTSLENGASFIYMRGVNFDMNRMSHAVLGDYLKTHPDARYNVNPHMNVMRIFLS